MRTALDVTPLLGARTGVRQTVHHLLAALPAADPDLEVVPFALSARARIDHRMGRPAPEHFPAGTRLLPVPASVLVRAWSRLDRPAADPWLGDTDLVHGTNFVVPPMRRLPTTVTVHDCWCARHPEKCRPQVRPFMGAVARAARRGAWLHVSTEFTAEEVRDLYETDRVAVVPFGVPPVQAPANGSATLRPELADDPFVLALGALDPRKALDLLVRAFGQVAAQPEHARLRLVLAGPDGPGRGAVETAIAALPAGVAGRVSLTGPVPDAERVALLLAARVLASSSRYEGFGFPLLEAMAAGTPVVATAAGAVPEVVGNAAELVPVGDADALAGALASVVTDESLRMHLVAAGRSRAETFSWDRTAKGMVALWQRLVA